METVYKNETDTQLNRRHSIPHVTWLLILSIVTLGVLLALPMDAFSQLLASLIILSFVSFCSNEARSFSKFKQFCRIAAIVMGLALTVRYLVWRSVHTLTAVDWLSMIAVWSLYIAEIYAGITHVLGCIVNVFPLSRPLLSLKDVPVDTLPSVDVMIPSYNEEESLLEITIRAAKVMEYPADKLTIHLLDDGGTDQKINQPNKVAAKAALERRHSLQALCKRLGAVYHTREKNEHAKAGNVNSAFKNTQGDLVVILDADHVPTSDFLDRTVPWMLKNDKCFLVQTPHFMANPDPVERNYFAKFSRMPSENDMFYGTIQKGLDYWSSSFFCGSAALMRRKHLELVGGISGDSITEDAETALDLHQLGYESVYVDRPMVSGLAPETFDAFIQQRMRWAQGMTQILLLKKPFAAKGLNWYQRMGYMSSIMFWLFPFARILFLLMPLAYLVFDLQVYHASLMEILAYTVPHVIATYMISTMLFGRTRWPLVSELYEILQCTFTLNALVKVFMRPRAPSFVVTPKGASLNETFVSPLATVFYWLAAILTFASIAGIYKFINEPLTRELTMVVLIWNSFNLLLMLSVMSVLVERKQIRNQARLPVTDSIKLVDDDERVFRGELLDISWGGARVKLRRIPAHLPEYITLNGWSEALKREVWIKTQILSEPSPQGIVRLRFVVDTDQRLQEVVAFTLCDSRRWVAFQRRRTRQISFWFGVRHVLSAGIKPTVIHLYYLTKKAWQNYRVKRNKAHEL